MRFTPNFHFQGDCERAIALYQAAFGATVDVLLYYKDANAEDGVYGDAYANLIYHAELDLQGQRMMMSDALVPNAPAGNTVSLLVGFDAVEDARAAYERLLDGGILITAPTTTSYSHFFASLIDRYGVRWELICEK